MSLRHWSEVQVLLREVEGFCPARCLRYHVAEDLTDDLYQEVRDRILWTWWNNLLNRGGVERVASARFGSHGRHFAQAHTAVEIDGNRDGRYGQRAWAWAGLARQGFSKDGDNATWDVADATLCPPPLDLVRLLHASGKTVDSRVRWAEGAGRLGAASASNLIAAAGPVEEVVRRLASGELVERSGAGGSRDRNEGGTGPKAQADGLLRGPLASDNLTPTVLPSLPRPAELDQGEWERAHLAHPETEALLGAHVRETFRVEVRSPGEGEPNFDRAWEHEGTIWVAEVKSLPRAGVDHAGKIRLALGQVLDYRWRLRRASGAPVRGVVVVESQPVGAVGWTGICADVDVILAWPAVFADRLRLRTSDGPDVLSELNAARFDG